MSATSFHVPPEIWYRIITKWLRVEDYSILLTSISKTFKELIDLTNIHIYAISIQQHHDCPDDMLYWYFSKKNAEREAHHLVCKRLALVELGCINPEMAGFDYYPIHVQQLELACFVNLFIKSTKHFNQRLPPYTLASIIFRLNRNYCTSDHLLAAFINVPSTLNQYQQTGEFKITAGNNLPLKIKHLSFEERVCYAKILLKIVTSRIGEERVCENLTYKDKWQESLTLAKTRQINAKFTWSNSKEGDIIAVYSYPIILRKDGKHNVIKVSRKRICGTESLNWFFCRVTVFLQILNDKNNNEEDEEEEKKPNIKPTPCSQPYDPLKDPLLVTLSVVTQVT